MKSRRYVTAVAEEGLTEKSKVRLYAFGPRAVAACCGLDERTVRRHHKTGEVDLASLKSVIAYILSHNSPATITLKYDPVASAAAVKKLWEEAKK